jgi:hypothetical protein
MIRPMLVMPARASRAVTATGVVLAVHTGLVGLLVGCLRFSCRCIKPKRPDQQAGDQRDGTQQRTANQGWGGHRLLTPVV